MKRGVIFALVAIVALAAAIYRSQLVSVPDANTVPRALEAIAPAERRAATLDVTLPVVPVGMRHLALTGRVMLVHYWAPWETDALDQIRGIDSLLAGGRFDGLDAFVVTFDPFPTVARYVGRHRLSVPVLLDGEHALRDALPCPVLPFTYLIDRAGRIAAAQEGPVDWHAEETAQTIEALLGEAATARGRVAPGVS